MNSLNFVIAIVILVAIIIVILIVLPPPGIHTIFGSTDVPSGQEQYEQDRKDLAEAEVDIAATFLSLPDNVSMTLHINKNGVNAANAMIFECDSNYDCMEQLRNQVCPHNFNIENMTEYYDCMAGRADLDHYIVQHQLDVAEQEEIEQKR